MSADPRSPITLTGEHLERAADLCDLIVSCAISAHEAIRRGSHPLALHHVREVRIALLGLLPLAKRLSNAALGTAPDSDQEVA